MQPINRNEIPLSFFMMFLFFFGFAQIEGIPLLFPQQFSTLNPARIGLSDTPLLGADFSSQWLGVPQAPQQQSIYFEIANSSKKIGYGAVIRNYSNFVHHRILLFGQFAHRIKLNKELMLRLGISAGVENYSLRFDGLRSVDSVVADPVLNGLSIFKPTAGIGMYLQFKKYFLSISTPRLLKHLVKNNKDYLLSNRFNYLLRMGGNFDMTTLWKLEFSAMLYNFNVTIPTLQLQSRLHHKYGSLFLSYGSKKRMGVGIIIQGKKIVSIGYAYQFRINPTTTFKANNHSLSIQFRLVNK